MLKITTKTTTLFIGLALALGLAGCQQRDVKINQGIAKMHASHDCQNQRTTLDVRACEQDGKY